MAAFRKADRHNGREAVVRCALHGDRLCGNFLPFLSLTLMAADTADATDACKLVAILSSYLQDQSERNF